MCTLSEAPRVMVVDTDLARVRCATAMLSRAGLEVRGFGSPEAALAELSHRRPDAVLAPQELAGFDMERFFEAGRAGRGRRAPSFVLLPPRRGAACRPAPSWFTTSVPDPMTVHGLIDAVLCAVVR